jgi:hypothetical protein
MVSAETLDWQFRDTRPEIVEQGASTEELLADYPAPSAETLSSALVFAETHPKRGRKPVTPPWRRQTSA